FIYENVKGEAVEKSGNMHSKMEIDTEEYPINYISNYDGHLDCKPPEKKKKTLTIKNEACMRSLIKKNEN
ncbi:hypothetical protein J3Q64DRAFT_1642409, partial [Phycomyces blakesleeanus]